MAALSPEVITTIGGFRVTNTFFTTIVIDGILFSLVYFIHKNIKGVPGKLQSISEMLFSYFYDLIADLAGNRTKNIFPWVMSFFLVIFITNISGLLPGVGSIGFFHVNGTTSERVQQPEKTATGKEKEFTPLLRPATSDFNMTLALGLISVIVTHALSIYYTGFGGYIKRFISFNPILLFVGLLELVSEFTKIVSLSFRLFGNIFAGEVVLHTISTLFAFFAPIPFMLLESIVAVVQALVFSMLTLVFMAIMTETHHKGGEH